VKWYIVKREACDGILSVKTMVVDGPFGEVHEAENVADNLENDEEGTIWYDVWDEATLRERGFL
jgi:hypothetical protein